jgi:bis(5'-nucleosyl)-tetraphosphatase (symmetrical)
LAVYAIGDIQGCTDELKALLDRLRFDPARDRLWLTGDLVNRGPDSVGSLRFVRSLGKSAVTVLGNHDLHLLAIAAGHGPGKLDPDAQQVLSAPDRDELLDWLRRRPLLHQAPELGWTMVHAGLPPQWSLETAKACAAEVQAELLEDPDTLFAGMYGNKPRRWSPTLSRRARLRFTINCLTRLRYVGKDGTLLLGIKGAPDSAPRGAIPWFRHPRRRSSGERIVFGHWSTLGLLQEDDVLCLDGGCVWGGSLCAARLDSDEPAMCLDCARHRRPGED